MFDQGTANFVSLDVSTLFIVATCISALLGVFLIFASTQDRIRALAWWGAAYLWRERRKSLMRRWPALFVPALHGAVFLFPIPIATLLPHERGLVSLTSGWIAVFVLEMLLYAIGTAFIVLVITKERTLRMHKTAALTDPMTGLFNRRGLMEATRELMENGARRSQPIAVLLFDLDHFKSDRKSVV